MCYRKYKILFHTIFLFSGQISPITPGREDERESGSPAAEGRISPLTPSNTPPHPPNTPPHPPPPSNAGVVDMEVDNEVGRLTANIR